MHIKSFLHCLSLSLLTSAFTFSSTIYASQPKVDQLNIMTTATTSNSLASRPIDMAMIPSAPKIDAKSYLMLDADSGKILAEQNANEKLAPASLTKLMTLYVIFNALENHQIHIDDQVRVSTKAWKTPGSRMFLKEGDKVAVNTLIKGIIVDSGNDACVAMAEYVAGSETAFVELMNRQAQLLGMSHSHFTDSNGLPNPDHYSTAADMAKLARAIITHFPTYYAGFSQKYLTYGGIKQTNRNLLLWRYEYADGLKTGHTNSAGYCLVASAKKDNMRLISVVMGAPDNNARADDSQRLLTYGFRFFRTHQVYAANTTVQKIRVWKGEQSYINTGMADNLYVTIPQGEFDALKATLHFNDPINAPVHKGQILGMLTIHLDGKNVATSPLIALQDSAEGGLWTRMSDSIGQSWHQWFHQHDDDHQG